MRARGSRSIESGGRGMDRDLSFRFCVKMPLNNAGVCTGPGLGSVICDPIRIQTAKLGVKELTLRSASVESYLDARRRQSEETKRELEARFPSTGVRERLLARRKEGS